MSGGHYDYSYSHIDMLADSIEADFLKDGKYMTEDWGAPHDRYFDKRPMIEANHLHDATEEQKPIILKEVKSLVKDLKDCAKRAKELEWYLSGDTGASNYIERLNLKA